MYQSLNHLDQVLGYYQQAVDIYVKLGSLRHEGVARDDIANILIKLNRSDDARPELLRAIECKKSYGHAAKPWETWNILHNLELADSNPQAAQQARQKAINAFLTYRRDGGENHEGAGRLALMVLQAIQQGDTAEIEQIIKQYLEQEDGKEHKAYLHQLQTIIAGDRTDLFGSGESCHAPTEYDDMHYQQVVELKLLLEQLTAPT